MQHSEFKLPLFIPGIKEYLIGYDVVCKLVLEQCKNKAEPDSSTVFLKSKLHSELKFSASDIIEVLLRTSIQLKIKISYSLLLQLDEHTNVEKMATQIWKYICRVVKGN